MNQDATSVLLHNGHLTSGLPVGLEQAVGVVRGIGAVGQPGQHVDVGHVEGRGQQVSCQTHKLVQGDLKTKQRIVSKF